MQMIGALNCNLHHCFVHPWGALLRRNVTILAEQRTFLLLWNSPFEVFVAFSVEIAFHNQIMPFAQKNGRLKSETTTMDMLESHKMVKHKAKGKDLNSDKFLFFLAPKSAKKATGR